MISRLTDTDSRGPAEPSAASRRSAAIKTIQDRPALWSGADSAAQTPPTWQDLLGQR